MAAVLQGQNGLVTLNSTTLIIGRSADSQLIVNDVKVSAHHAEIRPDGAGYSITDLGSANGTFVNEQRLQPYVARPLTTGDRIRIGDTVFTYNVITPTEANMYAPTIAAGPNEYVHTAYGQNLQDSYAPPPPPPYAPPYQQSYTPVPPSNPLMPPVPVQPTPLPPQPTPPQSKKFPKVLIIALVVLVVLGAGGGIALFSLLNRPQPVISVSSQYHVGGIPADSTTGVGFHISGQKFSTNSSITFLLDGTPVPGTATSDASGNLNTNLTVTDAWSLGKHILTARDASNYVTQSGIAVVIVQPGVANTPGPNGAPPDDKSFQLVITIQHHDVNNNQQFNPLQQTLIITGQPDPAGGTVCQSTDNDQTQTYDGTLNNGTINYHETYSETCSGTYKGGKLTYTQTVTSDQYSLSNGDTCSASTPYTYEQLNGTFTSASSISGTFSLGTIKASCTNGDTLTFDAESGTWSGQVQ